ncbi:hypothetical protein [Leifsonia poae]|uniref:Uncharacterized protein n=1 Tax=Leifsonia poae TaxID=110933 RepID=A0A9W6M0H2_9MICO|nr:hypothetical protein [Leifsonia poae]GLJ76920.1 hypothetical protein GCM10017584_24940 [Leifsonia poae]
MTIPNDDSKPDQPASDGSVPAPDAAGSVPPAAPVPPAPPAPDAAYPPAPPASAPGAFPSYAATPAAPAAAPTTLPSQVNIAFWLYIGAAVLSVISGIITVVILGSSRQSTIDSLQNSNVKTNGMTIDQLADASIAVGTTLAIITLIFWAIVFVLFAWFMRRGANWSRIILTILTVLSLINVPWGFGAGALQVVLAIVATILIWLKPASAYFAAVKASKAPRV